MTNLFFDTETTGLIKANLEATHENQPMPVQLGMKLDDAGRKEVGATNYMIRTEGWIVNPQAAAITGIDNALADKFGVDLVTGMEMFFDYASAADYLIAHNARFDVTVMRRATKVYCDKTGHKLFDPFEGKNVVCTMLSAMNIVQARPKRNGNWKWPKLEECTKKFFGRGIDGAHDALVDVRATAEVFYYLVDTGVFDEEPDQTRNIR